MTSKGEHHMSPFVSGALGAAAFLLLAGIVRRAAWHRRFRGGPRGRAFMLRHLFRRLRTRPEQEQVVTGEADALAAAMRELREDARALRADVAALLAAPTLDAETVRARLESRLARAEALKGRLAEGIARVHATLDPSQRSELAALVQRGPRFHHRRHAHGHA
jgi:Spy/CpxP family protein refolding chaperone